MKKIVPVVIVLAAVAIGLVIYKEIGGGAGGDATHLKVSGNIEVTEVQLSFRVAGWVQERKVNEGERIEKGAVVALMDPTEAEQTAAVREAEAKGAETMLKQLEAGSRPEEVKRAEATLGKAKAALAELEAGSRPEEKAAAEATAAAAKVEAGRLKTDFERIQKLKDADAATVQELDTARAASEGATDRANEAEQRLKLVIEGPRKETIEQARQAASEAEQNYELAKKGPRQEEIDRARAQWEQAKKNLAIAQTRLGWTTLNSPVTGMVLSQNVESGEYVSAGTPVVTVADLTKVWLRGYVSETDYGKVKLGQKVEVTTDTYPGKVYPGTVSFISKEAEFTPKSVQTPKERVKLVYRIKVDIDNTAQELKPGMPADGMIILGQ